MASGISHLKELKTRSITGACIVMVICLAIVLGPYAFFVLCAFIGLVGLFEFYRLFGIADNFITIVPAFVLAAAILLCTLVSINLSVSPAIFLLNIPILCVILFISLFEKSWNPFYHVGIILLGQIYIILSVALFYGYAFLLGGVFNRGIVIGYFLFLWASDAGAYIFGKLFGNRLLAPRISPNKTWEGSLGGAFLVVALVYVVLKAIGGFSLIQWMIIAVFVIVFGTLGDLLKSRMKRSFNVKDFGTLLPGHGGILDRFDSLIGSIPVTYCYIYADIYWSVDAFG
jgi:phosphatidate cytidylyltransferase